MGEFGLEGRWGVGDWVDEADFGLREKDEKKFSSKIFAQDSLPPLRRVPITTTEPSKPASHYLDLTSTVICGCFPLPLLQSQASPPSSCPTLSKPRFGDFHSLLTAPSSI